MPTPEELARQQIDALLQQCGWGFEIAAADQRTRDVQYNAAIPIETICSRS